MYTMSQHDMPFLSFWCKNQKLLALNLLFDSFNYVIIKYPGSTDTSKILRPKKRTSSMYVYSRLEIKFSLRHCDEHSD
jgi:hypothetical protein